MNKIKVEPKHKIVEKAKRRRNEVTATKLCLRNDWGFRDEIWIEELDVVTGVQAQ